jgi:hypothetical protein
LRSVLVRVADGARASKDKALSLLRISPTLKLISVTVQCPVGVYFLRT